MNKYLKTIIVTIISIVAMAFLGCSIGMGGGSSTVETVIETDQESEPKKLEKEESDEVIEDEKEEDAEDLAADEEILKGVLFDFLNAVKSDNEYGFFSSGTVDMAGSEEEYKNGDKSDIYFIIQESHSSWENIEFESIIIVDNFATVEIIGDRMAEGTKYEGDKVIFDFVKENDEWKIDFSF